MVYRVVMYMRENRSGGHTYVSLAHNERDEGDGVSRARLLYNFGRKDRLDLDAVRGLIASLSRYLPSDEVVAPHESGVASEVLEFVAAKRLGPAWLLDGVWRAVGVHGGVGGLLGGGAVRPPTERVEMGGQDESPADEGEGADAGADAGAEAGDAAADAGGVGAESGLRPRGHSKDKRPDLAQVVIAFAVTRDGIPGRCWVWPGDTVDVSMIAQVKRDLNSWKLSRTVLGMGTGFTNEANRRV